MWDRPEKEVNEDSIAWNWPKNDFAITQDWRRFFERKHFIQPSCKAIWSGEAESEDNNSLEEIREGIKKASSDGESATEASLMIIYRDNNIWYIHFEFKLSL